MRYDKPIYFQRFVQGSYNENTGNYEDDSIEEEMAMASIMDTKHNYDAGIRTNQTRKPYLSYSEYL